MVLWDSCKFPTRCCLSRAFGSNSVEEDFSNRGAIYLDSQDITWKPQENSTARGICTSIRKRVWHGKEEKSPFLVVCGILFLGTVGRCSLSDLRDADMICPSSHCARLWVGLISWGASGDRLSGMRWREGGITAPPPPPPSERASAAGEGRRTIA